MKNSRRFLLIFSIALTMPATLVASGTHTAPRIAIENFTFVPATLEVAIGTTVSWVNEDDVPHVVVGTDPSSPLGSGALDTDDAYSVELDHPGTYRYFCSLHPHMTGTVIVR